jgi:RecA-family ATPase
LINSQEDGEEYCDDADEIEEDPISEVTPELEKFLERISLTPATKRRMQTASASTAAAPITTLTPTAKTLPRQESVSVICHDSGYGDRVVIGGGAQEKYEERIRVARKILAEVNQTLLHQHHHTRGGGGGGRRLQERKQKNIC